MHHCKTVVSLCAEGTDTVFALSAGDMLAACTEQKRPSSPLYTLLPKIKADMSVAGLMECRPDVVLVPREYGIRKIEELESAGVEVLAIGGDTLEVAYDNIRAVGSILSRAAEAEKIVTKARYGFSLLEKQLCSIEKIRTAFFAASEPYTAAAGESLIHELLALNKLENIYGEVNKQETKPDLSTLRLLDAQLLLLPDYPEELTDVHAMELGVHTEHALTVFVPGELFRGGAPLMRLADFFRQLNEKIRRFSHDSLAERDKPTYF